MRKAVAALLQRVEPEYGTLLPVGARTNKSASDRKDLAVGSRPTGFESRSPLQAAGLLEVSTLILVPFVRTQTLTDSMSGAVPFCERQLNPYLM